MNSEREFLGALGHIASLAAQAGFASEALAIFEGIKAKLPDDVNALSGWAVAKISAGEYDEAIDVLKMIVLPADPENDLARCFLGLALKKNGQSWEGERLLETCLNSTNDTCRVMAAEALSVERA